MPKTEKEVVKVRLVPAVAKRLRKQAAKENRTISAEAERALVRGLAA